MSVWHEATQSPEQLAADVEVILWVYPLNFLHFSLISFIFINIDGNANCIMGILINVSNCYISSFI